MNEQPFMTVALPMLPPSTNHAYTNTANIIRKGVVVKRGSRRLSEEGEKFKKEAKAWLAQNALPYMATIRSDAAYWLRIVICTKVLNKGYPKTAKSRFVQFDGTNRIKLLEDVIAEVAGIDDSQFLEVTVTKRESARNVTIIQMGVVPMSDWGMEV